MSSLIYFYRREQWFILDILLFSPKTKEMFLVVFLLLLRIGGGMTLGMRDNIDCRIKNIYESFRQWLTWYIDVLSLVRSKLRDWYKILVKWWRSPWFDVGLADLTTELTHFLIYHYPGTCSGLDFRGAISPTFPPCRLRCFTLSAQLQLFLGGAL